MNILFLHRTFPGQFQHIAPELAKNPQNVVIFMTAETRIEVPRINKLVYATKPIPQNVHPYLGDYEEALGHAQAAADIAIAMKNKGIKPDIIYGHSWGSTMFMKDIFPDVPLLCYFEWFGRAEGSAIGFDGNIPNLEYREKIRCNNAQLLLDLSSCDAGITPTYWQREQFPKEFHHKIKVLHDGVDTNFCVPNNQAKFVIQDKNLTLTAQDEVITYGARGMEPFRGFPQFMEATEKLLKKRPNAHVVIAGDDRAYYGEPLKEGTYKELMLKKLNLDMNKVHFVGVLTLREYINLLQVSSAHVYLTYPYILSWSILNAMSAECCVIASNTAPVLEIMEDNYNGLFVDFFNVDELVDKIEYALDNQKELQSIRKNARQTVLDKYSLEKLLPQHIEYINDVKNKR
ncbi:MAG: glycosyltransferase [Candidatus Gastranaerophilales bacterium]|nr:glycosyltransferase [Candidatus Gastranaerophilales bacterium]